MEAEKGMAMSGPGTVPGIFAQTAQRFGEQTALRHKHLGLWHDISFAAYFDQVRRVGTALAAMGLNPGDKAAIIGDNAVEWVVADLGIQCVGGVSVGIYATNAWQQVEYVVTHSDAKFLFAENEEQLDKWLLFRDRAPLLQKVIVWDTRGLTRFSDPAVMTFAELLAQGQALGPKMPDLFSDRGAAVTPDDPCVLIYTSGTTGPPKGAILTHGNVTWMAGAVARTNPLDHRDQVLSFLPLCHIFERLFTVFIQIRYAYTVNFVEKPDTVMQNMIEVSPTVGYAVPRIWEKYYSGVMIRMADADRFKQAVFKAAMHIGQRRADLVMDGRPVPFRLQLLFALAQWTVFRKLKERLGFERIRVAYSGAAPISQEVLRFFQALGMNLIEGYGQTEGTGVTTLSPEGRVRFGTVGQAVGETRIRIADDGEILVKSPGVFKGYYKAEAATADTLKDGWLLTGDVGELDKDGFLKITDRKKDIIVTAGGKNITPQYIENKLKASLYINDAVVIGDRRKFIAGLIMIDEENVVKYAQDHKIQFSTYGDLTQSPQITDLIAREVAAVNQTLARVEQVRQFALLPKRLYEEDGEVTPTMKIKRRTVETAFKDLVDQMYRKGSRAD